MAKLLITGMDTMMAELRRMQQQAGPVARAMISAGASVMVESWKQTIQQYGLVDTGAMLAGTKALGIVDEGAALYVDITSDGKDAKGVRNGAKAHILHYGTSRIKSTYWVDQAEAAGEPLAAAAMQAILDRYMSTGFVPAVDENNVYTSTGGRRRKKKK